MFHPYWRRHEEDRSDTHIFYEREKMTKQWHEPQGIALEFDSTVDTPGEHDDHPLSYQPMLIIPAFQESSRRLEPGAEVKDKENQRGQEVKNYPETYKKELGRYVSWAIGKSLFDQMRCLAFQLGTDVLSRTIGYLRAGIQNLSYNNDPLAAVLYPHQARWRGISD